LDFTTNIFSEQLGIQPHQVTWQTQGLNVLVACMFAAQRLAMARFVGRSFVADQHREQSHALFMLVNMSAIVALNLLRGSSARRAFW
jgi:hypothetical protein